MLDIWCETFHSCSQGLGDCLGVAPAEKASLLGSQFDSKQCRVKFVIPLSCFPQSRCNSWPSKSLSSCVCLSILIRTGSAGHYRDNLSR